MRLFRLALMASAAIVGASSFALAGPADDTIVVGFGADISTLDPGEIGSRSDANVAGHIFTTLTRISESGEVSPNFAESWSVSDDGKDITFKLQAGRVCEDGEALTAEDAAYSFTRAADPAMEFTGNTPGFVFPSIGYTGAEAVDDTTLVVHMANKNSLAPGFLNEVYIHCKDSYEKLSKDDATAHPVASGSYKLKSWTAGSELVLEKWQDPGNFTNIVFRIIPEASTRTAELMAGNVDIITNAAPDQLDAIDASGSAKVQKVQGTRRMYVGFNQKAKFDTPGGMAIKKADVRRALQYAVDVPTICEQLLNFTCERATGLANPPHDNKDLKPYAYDPAMAEKLLDEAGYPRDANGVRFEMTLQGPRGRYLNDANVTTAVGQYLSDIGVKTTVELYEWSSVYVPMIRAHDAGPMFFLGSGGGLWNAQYDMSDLATVDSGPNYTEWNDPRWFDRWADITKATSVEEEDKIVNEMLKVFYDDGPWLLMYFQPDFYGVSNRVSWTARRDEVIELNEASLAK